MATLLSKETWVFSTRGVDGTLTIGACFVFLAYILHPAIEMAYRRVRAYRAWREIEKGKSVDVTNYFVVEEVFGGRGKWDAARIITVLLAAFSLASWGLELSMDLAYYEGDTDLLNRPPPVITRNISGTKHWQVKTQQELGTADWRDLPNMFENGAKSRYYMEANTRYEGAVNGAIGVAYWGTEAAEAPSQFYFLDGHTTTVKGLKCTGTTPSNAVDVYLGADKKWGSVLECEQGPSLTDELLLLQDDKYCPPPTIIMTSSEGEIFLIVEEDISYPSFLYSVWTVARQNGLSTELKHAFHIAATMRLAEAVVTGIVHGEISGGGCFGVLRKFSETRRPCEGVVLRASPFGEHPTGDRVKIQDLEHIEVGLEISMNALVCSVCLMVLTSIGIAWLCSVRSSIGMDVYDRDELIRAVSISGTTDDCALPSQMRIFVSKEDSGELKVVINDAQKPRSHFARILKKGLKNVKPSDPKLATTAVAPSSDDFAGTVVPLRSPEVVLGGVRVRPTRAASHPDRFFHCPTSVSLTASPIPWRTSSVPGSPGQYIGSAKSAAQMGRRNEGGRRASSLFDTVYISRDSDDEGGTDGTQVSCDLAAEGSGESGACPFALASHRRVMPTSDGVHSPGTGIPRQTIMQGMCNMVAKSDEQSGAHALAPGERRRVDPVPEDKDHVDLEMSTRWCHGRGNGTDHCISDWAMTDIRERSLPSPPLVQRRGLQLVPPLSGPLTKRCKENTVGSTSGFEDAC